MKSLFNATDKQEIIRRIDRLTPSSPAQWGKMRVEQMLAHCQSPFNVVYGDIQLKEG